MLTEEFISNWDMHYIPEPIPQSIYPARIFEAIIPQDSRPDEQSLLIATIDVVSGIPATNIAILKWIYPAPTIRLFPTQMSWTLDGWTLALSIADLKTVDNKTSGAVSLSPPLLALVRGVLTAEHMTTSSGLLVAIFYWTRWVLSLSSLFIKY